MRISPVTVRQNYSINKNQVRNQVSTPISQPVNPSETKPINFTGILSKLFKPKDMNAKLEKLLNAKDILEIADLLHRKKITGEQLKKAVDSKRDFLASNGFDLEFCDHLIQSSK